MNTGLDPELLTLNNGYIVPASYFLDAPKRDANGILNSISFDNAAVEIRPEQSDDLDILADNTDKLLHKATVYMRLARRRQKIPPNSELSFIPAARLNASTRFIKSVGSFGCSPSQTVLDDYSVRTTELRANPSTTAFRSAGFHIHQELAHSDTEQPAVAILDGLLGLTDVLVNCQQGWNTASKIRRVDLGYGRAGEHRVRTVPSGHKVLEYRVMSPWPLANAKHILWATSVIKEVCESQLDTLLSVLDAYPDRFKITNAINHIDLCGVLQLQELCKATWSRLGSAHA